MSLAPELLWRQVRSPTAAIEVDVEQRHRLVDALEEIADPAVEIVVAERCVARGRVGVAVVQLVGGGEEWTPVGGEIGRADKRHGFGGQYRQRRAALQG